MNGARIYTYEQYTGEYTGFRKGNLDLVDPSRTLLPTFATFDPPPEVPFNKVPVWEDGEWTVKLNNRGMWYHKQTQDMIIIKDIDVEAPPNCTRQPPPPGKPTWEFDGVRWSRTLGTAKRERSEYINDRANEAYEEPIEFQGYHYTPTQQMVDFLKLMIDLAAIKTEPVEMLSTTGVKSIPLNDARLLWIELASQVKYLVTRRHVLLHLIDISLSIAEVDAIEW